MASQIPKINPIVTEKITESKRENEEILKVYLFYPLKDTRLF